MSGHGSYSKTYTEDFADFGYREQEEAKNLFQAWRESGLPIDFENNGVKIAFNMNSGYVFLTNSEYQVAMCETNEHNKLELYSFYSSPYEYLYLIEIYIYLQNYLVHYYHYLQVYYFERVIHQY